MARMSLAARVTASLVDVLQNLRHHERPEYCENDHHDHDLDQGKTARALVHSWTHFVE